MRILADILDPAFTVNDAVRVILQSFQHGAVGKILCGYLSLFEIIFGVGVDKVGICDVLFQVAFISADKAAMVVIAHFYCLRVEGIGNADVGYTANKSTKIMVGFDFTGVVRVVDISRQFC